MNVRLACVQMTSTNDVIENLEKLQTLLKNQKMDILVLPEMCLSIGNHYSNPRLLEFSDSIKEVQKIAKQNNTILIAGTIKQPQINSDKNLASCYAFDVNGSEVAQYQKIHLFDADVNDKQGAYRESQHYDAGQVPCVFDANIEGHTIKIGIAICYDLRFSLLFHELKQEGAQLIVVPAAFVYKTGNAHWEVLLRARAIEFGVYILACNQTGWHDETRQTFGHSMLIDPWGNIVDSLKEEEAILFSDVNIEEIINPQKLLNSYSHIKKFEE